MIRTRPTSQSANCQAPNPHHIRHSSETHAQFFVASLALPTKRAAAAAPRSSRGVSSGIGLSAQNRSPPASWTGN